MEWTSCAVVYTVLYHLTWSCTITNTIIHGHGTRVIFLKVLKIVHDFTDTLKWPECNSDKATVGSDACTVYTDGQPYKSCVLCGKGLTISFNICLGTQKYRLIETVLLSTHNIIEL